MTYHAKVIAGGKIVIPADLRRELGIRDGDSLVLDRDESGAVVLRTYDQVVQDVQARFRRLRGSEPTGGMVEELMAERREEGRREHDEFERWVTGAE